MVVADSGYPIIALPGGLTSLTYDPRGMVSRQDNYNATHSARTYDANGQTLQMEHLSNAGAVNDRAWYQFDAANRPISKQTADSVAAYGCDHADRLTSEINPISGLLTCTYEVVGRKVTSQCNACNRSRSRHDIRNFQMQSKDM